MLVGIIKEQLNDYYIHINKENNKNILDIIRVDDKNIDHLNKEEIIKLICNTLVSKLTFKEKKNGYDIYLDEAGNKRYFKDGKEDYKLLLLNNGTSAVLYEEDNDSENEEYEEKIDEEEAKWFIFKNKKRFVKVCLSICLISIIADGIFIYKIREKNPSANEMYLMNNGVITMEKIEDYINSSPYLEEEEKKFLYNEDLIYDILKCCLDDIDEKEESSLRKNYELYQKFNGINIKIFPVGEKEALGYYSTVDPNTIHVCEFINNLPTSYYDVIAHEYVHLLQSANLMSYLCETSAELISTEYFNTPLSAYQPQVIRLKVLMEIIGPDPVFKYSFKNDDKSLENALKQYLNEDEYNRIIELFKTTPRDWGDGGMEEEVNKELDELFAKMYFNKTGENIKDNIMITAIYNGHDLDSTTSRIYFNKNHKDYYKDFSVIKGSKIHENIPFSEARTHDIQKYVYYTRRRLTEEEANSMVNNNIIWENILYEPVEGVVLIDNSGILAFKKDDEIYDQDTAIAKGLLVKKKEICIRETTEYFEYRTAMTADYFEFYFADGTIGKYKYNLDTSEYETIERYEIIEKEYPSIDKIFAPDNDEKLARYKHIEEFREFIKEQEETTKHI